MTDDLEICDPCITNEWCLLAGRCLSECLPTDEDAPLRAVCDVDLELLDADRVHVRQLADARFGKLGAAGGEYRGDPAAAEGEARAW